MGINVPQASPEPISRRHASEAMLLDQAQAENAMTNTDFTLLGNLGTREKAPVSEDLLALDRFN